MLKIVHLFMLALTITFPLFSSPPTDEDTVNGPLKALPVDCFAEVTSHLELSDLCRLLLTQKFPKHHLEQIYKLQRQSVIKTTISWFKQKNEIKESPQIPSNISMQNLEGFVLKTLFKQNPEAPTPAEACYKCALIRIFNVIPEDALNMKLLNSMPGLLSPNAGRNSQLIAYLLLRDDISAINHIIENVEPRNMAKHFANIDTLYYPEKNYIAAMFLNFAEVGAIAKTGITNKWCLFELFDTTLKLRNFSIQDKINKGQSTLSLIYNCGYDILNVLSTLNYKKVFLPNKKAIKSAIISYDLYEQSTMQQKVSLALGQNQ